MTSYTQAAAEVLGHNEFSVETKDGVQTIVLFAGGNPSSQQKADIDALWQTDAYQNPAPSSDNVNTERERRIIEGTLINITGYGDVNLEGRAIDRSNLSDLAFAASLRISIGDTTTTTPFRDKDNVSHDLTPPNIIELWTKASAYVSFLYEKSWEIKAMDPIPDDYTDDSYWSV
jgi:hypothetical protein